MTRILLKRAGNLVLRLLNSDGNEITTSCEAVQTALTIQALSIVNIQAGTLELLQLERLEPLEPGSSGRWEEPDGTTRIFENSGTMSLDVEPLNFKH
jgi:hypothetical protein